MPTLGESEDHEGEPRRRTPARWHDLPLRAQGLLVLAVPVLGLAVAGVLVAVGIEHGESSTGSVVTLVVLAATFVASTLATLAFMHDLARRTNHLRTNAERLARDAQLAPAGAGQDELATAERTLARAAEVLATRQRQLEDAQASLEHLVSAGPMVMFAGELATRLADESPLFLDYISSNSARVMGHSPVALLADPGAFIALVHDEDVKALLDAARGAVGDGRSQITVEFRIQHLDGSWRAMEGIVRGHETDPTRVLCYAVDITARRAAEQAQQESESRLSAFLDNSNALISLKDPFGRYQFANRALAELFGTDGGRIVGTDDFDHWPDAAPMLRARDQQVLVTREPMQYEETIELADGPHTFLSVKFPLLDPDGVPVAVGSISTDITEVKDAVASVAARERVLSTVIGASPDVITILEDDGTIRTTSVAFERIFGYPTRVLVDQRLVDLVHRDDREETERRLAELHDGRASRMTLRFRGRTIEGVWVTIESHAQVITGPDGTHDGIVMVSRDVTDQIALEQALRRAKEQAERANNAKSDFLSRVSHELRTPLNAMLGFTQLLEMEELDQASTEYVDQISKAGDHLLALINEVLDIARIESDNVMLQTEPIVAIDALREVIELTTPIAARASVTLEGPDGDPTILVEADRQRLLQVLLNLVSNAIKYNGEHGRVALAVEELDQRVRLTVTDTGPGLSEDQIERIFVPFDRLGREHSGIEGTGVGLALSRALTERMGGTLTVQSTPGKGSSFCVELPATGSERTWPPAPVPPTTTDRSPDPHPSLTGGRP